MFDELIGEEEGWTGWYETLLKTRGWFPRGGTYIYRERELYEFRCEVSWLENGYNISGKKVIFERCIN